MVPVNGSGEPSIPPASPSQRHKGQCTRSVAVHPIRRGAMPTDRVQRPNQQEQTRYRQVNRCHDPSKLHEGRRWVELNREISRRANPLLCGAHRWDRRARAGFEARCRAKLGRLASWAERRPRAHQAAGPSKADPSGARKTAGAHSNGGASPRPTPPLRPLHEVPRHTLTAWRPRS